MDRMSTAKIFDLNNDCLLAICGALSLKDQIHFACACKSFQEIFKQFTKLNYKVVPVTRSLTEDEVQKFIRLVGEYLIESDDVDFSNRLLRSVPESAQLKLLEFWCNDRNDKYLHNINKFKNLEILEIFIETYDAVILLLETLQKNSSIKKVHLASNSIDDGDIGSYNCGCIEDLTIELSNFDIKTIIKICASVPNLRKFTLVRPELGTAILRTLIQKCTNLEYLSCRSLYECEQELIGEIPNLKFLKIGFFSRLKPVLLKNLVEKRAHQLEGLELRVEQLSNSIYDYNIINNFENLRYLCLNVDKIDPYRIIKKVILPKLEYIRVESYINVDEFLLQILRDNLNLRFLNFKYSGSFIVKPFIDRLVRCLQEQKANYCRTYLPIRIKVGMEVELDAQELDEISPFIKFYDEENDGEDAVRQIWKDFEELEFDLY